MPAQDEFLALTWVPAVDVIAEISGHLCRQVPMRLKDLGGLRASNRASMRSACRQGDYQGFDQLLHGCYSLRRFFSRVFESVVSESVRTSTMQVQVEKTGPCECKVFISIPADMVDQAFEQVFRKVARAARIPVVSAADNGESRSAKAAAMHA